MAIPDQRSGEERNGRPEQGVDLLERLNAIARVVTEGLELQPMLQRVTDLLVDSFDWDHAGFARVDRERGMFVAEAVSSRLPTKVSPGYSRPLGDGIVGLVAQSGRPMAVENVDAEPGYVPVTPGVRFELCVPIHHGGDVVAILNLEDRRRRSAAAELPLVEAIARQIGGAIANARLHEEVLRRADQLELLASLSRSALEAEELEPVLQRMADRLRDRFDLLLSSVYFLDPHRPRLELKALSSRRPLSERPLASMPISRGIVGRALHLRRAQLVLDVRSDRDYVALLPEVVAELAIPIHFRDRLLGVFNFENDRPQVFSQETVALLQTLCDQLAGLMHLAAVNRSLQETTDELEHANRRLQEMNRALEELSIVDSLTGLANRRQFDRLLDLEWRRGIRTSSPVSLLLIDIDSFKKFNDTHGHLRGDAALAEVAGLLAAAFTRAGDLVARYGGEEFAALLPNTTPEAAFELGEQARARVEGRAIAHPASETSRVVTVSLGVATTVPDPWRLPTSLVERADRALYLAKAGGKNLVRADA